MKVFKVGLVFFHIVPHRINISKVLVCFEHSAVLLQVLNVGINARGGLIDFLNKGINLLMKVFKIGLVFFHIAPYRIHIFEVLVCFEYSAVLLQVLYVGINA